MSLLNLKLAQNDLINRQSVIRFCSDSNPRSTLTVTIKELRDFETRILIPGEYGNLRFEHQKGFEALTALTNSAALDFQLVYHGFELTR